MRSLLLFSAAVCALGLRSVSADAAAESLADLKKNALNCVSGSGLTHEVLRQCCLNDPTDPDILTKHKKFTYCMQNSVGILQSDGLVDPEKATVLVKADQKPRMLEIAKNCLGGDTTDLNEKAHTISVCYRAANSTMYVDNCNSVLDFVLS